MDIAAKILCVDDEPNILRALKRIFMEDGYELLAATSGTEGLDLLAREAAIEVVLSDYRMPGMNGVEFLKQVRAQWPETIRIVLSGFADLGVVLAAINEGQIYKFIPKPWNDDELKVTVAKAVEVYRLQRQNRQLAEELLRANAELARLNADLARIVEERTGRLFIQQRATMVSQDILAALPVAVVALDATGQVLYRNRAADALCLPAGSSPVNAAARDCLPVGVDGLLARLSDAEQPVAGVLPLAGGTVRVTAVRLRCSEGPAGAIMLIQPVTGATS